MNVSLRLLVFLVAGFTGAGLFAASGPERDLRKLLDRVNAKFEAGLAGNPAEVFARETADFEALRVRYADDTSESGAHLAIMHAMFHAQVLGDTARALELLSVIPAQYPGTQAAEATADIRRHLEHVRKGEAVAEDLVGRPAPELHFNWSTDADLSRLSDLRGQVVVLDFWATWCGPCVRSFPELKELANHYADARVEVIGVTSLQGTVHGLERQPIDTQADPDREHALMNDYIAQQEINWTIAFSEEEVFNPDYGIIRIPHMAIVAPDGTLRHVGLHPAMAHDAKLNLIDAILEEFDLPVPAHR